MNFVHIVTALFWTSAAMLAAGLFSRAELWRQGRPSAVSLWSLLHIPKRYLVDVHQVVGRDPYMAYTHMAAAGGAVAIIGLVTVNYGFALYLPTIDRIIAAAATLMLVGTSFVWLRRRQPPARLSLGEWQRLPYTLALFALAFIIIGLNSSQTMPLVVSGIAVAFLTVGAAEFALGIGNGGPMKHAVAGLLHLAFHTRPERFSGKRSTDLRPLDLELDGLGAGTPSSFTWNQLLSFDACVQCGKCEASCPAFAAGQPLNPKKLIQDLVAGFTGTSDATYSGSPSPGIAIGHHSGSPDAPIVPALVEPRTLWSCTTCRACVEECPMLIEHVDAITAMRRKLNLHDGEAPGKAADTLANLRETATQGGHDRSLRYAWAIDLDVPTASAGVAVDVLLFAGEGSFDARSQQTLRSLTKILKAAGTDFAVFGSVEHDTGDLARRLGDEATFQQLARANIQALSKLTFKTILTADPHVLHSLKNEYAALGGRYHVEHHSTFVAKLIRDEKLKLVKAAGTRLTYHDPCYLGRYNGEFDAPRQILNALGIDLAEMQRSRSRSRCCGGGGGAPLTDIPGQFRIPDQRIGDAREVGARLIAVGCPQCMAMLEGVAGDRPEVLDIAELVAAALEVKA